MEWIVSQIINKLGEKYSFLKLISIVYKKKEKECLLTFIYPENERLTDDEKEKIENFIVSSLNLNAKVFVKFKKSYLDNELVLKSLFKYIDNNYPSLNAFIQKENTQVEKDFSQIKVILNIDEEFLTYINEFEFKNRCKEYLENNFCSEFLIDYNKIHMPKTILNKKTQQKNKPIARFEVKVVKQVFGGDIPPNPEFIKNIKSPKKSVILAGKVKNIEKKFYEVKKGKQKGTQKCYFSFVLDDTTSKIDARYFSTITNEKKMDIINNNFEVLTIGDVEQFNQRLTYYVKSLSLCELPEKIYYKQSVSKDYESVAVEPYSIISQENLFKKSIIYSQEVLSNNYVVFDVETTGLNYEEDEIIELGAVKIEQGKIVSKFSTLVKPKNPIPPSATIINNITNEMVVNAPAIEPVLRDFYRYTRNCILVGYNVAFDQKFILQAAKKQGISFDNNFFDLMPLAKNKLKLSRYKLVDVVKRLDINLDGAHRAYADALATAEAFLKLNANEY